MSTDDDIANIQPSQVKSPPKSQVAVGLIASKSKGLRLPPSDINAVDQREEDVLSGIDKEILQKAQPATSIVNYIADDRPKSVN